jgi:hypothetical protein
MRVPTRLLIAYPEIGEACLSPNEDIAPSF